MSLVTNITNLATRVATEVKALRTLINGNASSLSSLTTTANTNLVAAINELDSDIAAVASDLDALIDDTSASSTSVYSSTKTEAVVSAAVAALVDSAPATLDTLNELAAALGDDASYATTVTTALAGKSDTGHSHSISDVTSLQTALDAKVASSDIGDVSTNYVTTFEAGLA